VRVLHVVDARAVPLPPPVDLGVALADAMLGPEAHAEQEREVRAEIADAIGRDVDWPVRVTLGAPASAIVAEAARVGAGLVVLGLQPHGRLARLAQDETAVHVARAAACPVLAVAAGLHAPPRRAMAAVDFSGASLDAARAALALLGGAGTLVLAYAPPLPLSDDEDGERRVHALGVEAAFAWLERELAAPPGVRVERVVLRGEPPCPVGRLVIDHAAHTGRRPAGGGQPAPRAPRAAGARSVTADVLRDGRVSVLVIPPVPGAPPR
jgi:nucleotide-binding universal stress UspA family protein